jgi:hypothetical protein
MPPKPSNQTNGSKAGDKPVELKPIEEAGNLRAKGSPNPFLTRANLMLLAMFGAGFGGLYVLSLRNGPSTALADQTLVHAKVEAALNTMGVAPTAADLEQHSRAKAIVNEFYTAARQRQIDLEKLRGNPFIFRKPDVPATQPAAEPNEPNAPPPAEPGEKEAMQAVQGLQLQSVLIDEQGDRVAFISSNLVATGQTIMGWTVVRINPTEVELSWREKKHVLKMQR